MNYRLSNSVIGQDAFLDLSGGEYADIVASMQRLYLAKDVEEKLDLLLENYFEYEGELLDLGLRYSLFRPLDELRMADETQLLIRRTLNLLSAASMYVDQVKHAVSQYFKSDESRKADIERLFSAEYDQYLEYRIGAELRNHVMHRGLPLHNVSWPSEWEEIDSPERRLRFSVVPSLLVDDLVDEGGFKPKVLEDMQASGRSSWPLTPILRRYVESMTTVHGSVRKLLSEQVDRDYQVLLMYRARANAELGPSVTGLVVIAAVGDRGNVVERHYLSERFWERRRVLMCKNNGFQNLSLRYVSGEHPGDAAQRPAAPDS